MNTQIIKLSLCAVVLAAGTGLGLAAPASYPDPEAAVDAFVTALQAHDKAALLAVMGPEAEDLMSSGDKARDAEARDEFLAGYELFHGLNDTEDGKKELIIGRVLWPFPILLVKDDAGWRFDPDPAREEILARRVGLNELDVIDLLGKVPAVQAQFRTVDYDGDGVMEFASSILSTPGQRDGLYWPHEDGAPDSPVGAEIAMAAADGYSLDGVDQDPAPYLGYYFRILTKQGAAAPGGALDYMINGNMVAGYAVLAYPADPGNTGVMSFVVGESGVIYQKDLGDDTLAVAAAIDAFDPGEGWEPVVAEAP